MVVIKKVIKAIYKIYAKIVVNYALNIYKKLSTIKVIILLINSKVLV